MSLVFHLLLIGVIWWLLPDLSARQTQIEPEAMVLDLAAFTNRGLTSDDLRSESSAGLTSSRVQGSEFRVQNVEDSELRAQDPDTKAQLIQKAKEETVDKKIKQQTPQTHISASPDPDITSKQQQTSQQKHSTPKHSRFHNKLQGHSQNKRKKRNVRKTGKHKIRHHANSIHKKVHGSGRNFSFGRLISITKSTQKKLGFPRIKSQNRFFIVTVGFTLHANGRISRLRIIRRSGSRAIDHRALSVIRKASRRYPHPRSSKKINITLHYKDSVILQ